jgi:hypothetical protein
LSVRVTLRNRSFVQVHSSLVIHSTPSPIAIHIAWSLFVREGGRRSRREKQRREKEREERKEREKKDCATDHLHIAAL